MNVPFWVWVVTVVGLVGVIVADLIIVDRRPHEFGTKSALRWVLFYIGCTAVFAAGIWVFAGSTFAVQFVAGYLTEYSLSVDNLFVFMVIMSSFAVPKEHQHRVLLVGIAIALVLRAILILIGAAAIHAYVGVFYLFGAFLLYTAWTVWRSDEEEVDPQGNRVLRLLEKRFPTTRDYHGTKLTVRIGDHRVITPMLLVMVTIGTTDLLFAVDSIPAVFGLTNEAYIVFTVNAFALMGLRQLFFLLRDTLGKLVFLNRGLAVILAFIGVKLVLEAVHGTTSLPVPTIPVWASLLVIVVVLAVTVVASLVAVRRHPGLAVLSEEQRMEQRAAEEFGKGLEDLPEE